MDSGNAIRIGRRRCPPWSGAPGLQILRGLAMVFGMHMAFGGPGLAGSLVLHLRLDDGAQSLIAADSSGRGHDGVLVNMEPATDSVAGQANLALQFDGINEYVEVADHPDLSFGRRCFTVSYWVNKLQTSASFDNLYGVSMWRTGASPGANEWVLNVGTGIDQDRPTFLVEVGTTVYGAISPSPISLGAWHHLVGVRDGNTVRLYIDGVLVAVNDTLPDDAAVNENGLNLRIAVNQPPAPLFYTHGRYDDLQVYDYALDDGGVSVGDPAGGSVGFLFANPGVTVSAPAPALGSVPDGHVTPGAPLLAELELGGEITLTWDESCQVGNFTDYAVYEGTIGDFTSHAPVACSTGGQLSATFPPGSGDTYYLVVPRDGCHEGLYGRDGFGVPRPQGQPACCARGNDGCQQ